jgi:hypothetical protein
MPLAVDGNRDLYIADHLNSRIQKWEKGARKGTTVAGVTGVSGVDGDLQYLQGPMSISVDKNQSVYTTESFGQLVQWEKGATSKTVVAKMHEYGYVGSYGHYRAPNGDFYVSAFKEGNSEDGAIFRVAHGTNQVTVIAGNKGSGNNSNQLKLPWDLGLDENGNLFVTDYRNNRIQLFTADSAKTKQVNKAGLYKIEATAFNGCISTDSIRVFAGTYTLNGNADWNDPGNWDNNTPPPAVIPAHYLVTINPASGECTFPGDLRISKDAVLKVMPGKKLVVTGNLIVE